ncbi:hypothetical protein P43SY_007716 [Pythium insidiosum]|uniref:E2F-associated phosphoprotein n=1 Tax=Pythium insidiosum TaxID=114742 RepID=A0AAD5LPA1_PYTIN|nr:hypothetical protein P43SY_007716 [Pythium insidiosum]
MDDARTPPAPWASRARPPQRRDDAAFGLAAGDAEDFYDVVMSSEDDASDGDAEEPATSAAPNPNARDVSAQRLLQDATASSARAAVPKDVLQPIGGGAASGARSSSSAKAVSDETPPLTADELDRHAQRRAQLESALDTLLNMEITPVGDAPFRFREPAPLPSPAPEGTAAKEAMHGPQLSEHAKKKKKKMVSTGAALEDRGDSSSDDEAPRERDPDPLYDGDMDDADAKWVQTNLRDRQQATTDATLCCPCCFVTVCMDCQRHARYPNQYRARVAMNCRVKKDEVLTYGSEVRENTARQQIGDHRRLSRMERGHALPDQRLGRDDYFAVACSDCGTTVGVYDHEQFYHFFNVLPSHC